MPKLTSTLRFQFAVLAALNALLVASALLANSAAIRSQALNTRVIELVDRTNRVAARLIQQNQQYLANMPGDFETYYRDVRLFYQDQQDSMDVMEDAMREIVPLCRSVELGRGALSLVSGTGVLPDLLVLQTRLTDFRSAVERHLGSRTEPQLQASAAYITVNGPGLLQATRRVLGKLKELSSENTVDLQRLNQGLLIFVLLSGFGAWLWFWFKASRPLGAATRGVDRIRLGEFGTQVPVFANNELATLIRTFNDHSRRLDCIFRLLGKLQRGLDLDETLRYVSEDFSQLIPMDWVGALFPAAHGQSVQLRCAFADGAVIAGGAQQFPLHRSLLEKAMLQAAPLSVADLAKAPIADSDQAFLAYLQQRNLHSAVFLPLSGKPDVPGVLVVASRKREAYGEEQLALLANIAHLVTQSFANTVRLINQRRLALIGEFVAAIVHEIRNPLTSIRLAAAYFAKAEHDDTGSQYAGLLERESLRMQRLLDEVLSQARPLELHPETLDIADLVRSFYTEHQDECMHLGHALTLGALESAEVFVDPGRFSQVLLNLLRNALDSASDGTDIVLAVEVVENRVRLQLSNAAAPISDATLECVFEPFMTTKAGGTGLGLSIVRRFVEAHGGDVALANDGQGQVVATVWLPVGAPAGLRAFARDKAS